MMKHRFPHLLIAKLIETSTRAPTVFREPVGECLDGGLDAIPGTRTTSAPPVGHRRSLERLEACAFEHESFGAQPRERSVDDQRLTGDE